MQLNFKAERSCLLLYYNFRLNQDFSEKILFVFNLVKFLETGYKARNGEI